MVKTIIVPDYEEMSREAVKRVIKAIKKYKKKKGYVVVVFPTGRTPLGLYEELRKMYKEGKIDFSNVKFFMLDEYELPRQHERSYNRYLERELWKPLEIKEENIHRIDGLTPKPEKFCMNYEDEIKKIGGLDLVVLGIGRNGHIGFNEPGSPKYSRTRVVELDERTREAVSEFFGGMENVPKRAITMGVGTIMEAREIILLASGKEKANAIVKALEDPISEEVPASFLRGHKNVTFILDREAASKLRKYKDKLWVYYRWTPKFPLYPGPF